ncbi:alpha/beta fold hydrolase [Pseudonocardia sp.]|uniref:alpha/beta fold hydrolase n=1 Tax=Pseudonocardia sp. TaxID=60912 RepID=UPI003D0A2AC5
MAAAAAAIVVAAVAALWPDGRGADDTVTPDVAAPAGPLADQELSWETCEFGDDGPLVPGSDVSNVECATVTVPRDWLNPDPDLTWNVRVPGGPYASGLSYGTTVQLYTPELRPTTNYVSFDQRGLGQSSQVACEYVYDPAGGPSAAAQAVGEECSKDPDVATMTTEQTAYDMDFFRHLLGLDTVTYVGYSYGTWLGTWYGALFAKNIDRMVLDSATDSTQQSIQTLYNAAHEGRDRQFRLHMMDWIARNDATIGLGTDPEEIWERYFTATRDPQRSLAARYSWTAARGSLAFSTPALYPVAGSLVASIISQSEASTDPVHPVELAARIVEHTELPPLLRADAERALALLATPPATESGQLIRGSHNYVIEFTACTDGQWTQGLEFWDEFHERTAATAPLSAQFGLLVTPTCAFWPTDTARPALDDSFSETIVLQSELDSMTPYEQGWAAGTGLPNTSLIAVDNESIHGVFPYGTVEVDRPVIDFLLGGDRPLHTVVAPAKPLPLERTTFESWTPLDDNARHAADPRFTDPRVVAETATPRDSNG